MRNRCRHGIVRDILSYLRQGEAPLTRICVATGLPVDRGRRMLELLSERGLVAEVEGQKGRVYTLTPVGYEWLGLYERLENLLPLSMKRPREWLH